MAVRDMIILKAQELIYFKGYVATSISDIITASGVGKGQLYHYFSSKKELGVVATKLLLDQWRIELFQGIFQSEKSSSDKLSAMLDWVYDFHLSQDGDIFYGCPVGNLIVELSTQDEEFRLLLQGFMEEWQSKLSDVLDDSHPNWSKKKSLQEAQQIIVTIQGAIVLLKVNQNLAVIETTMTALKEKYL
ncbi:MULTISPECIES: TetR/AcrR family transcriptional regulator [Streptococcus]|uniref:TetR/AcrR family transcriptional regulator n=1 Tax=Streptococcus caledonicus TaxID=2614158 RepID=A0ABW0UG18_9STRE|nr:TetR/AcrR family transcriptional regulator [Streptococcus sp. S784/96/1]